tara:strand:+ start:71 stop:739 length:669 start_codon:yes stop_codon:yes gene_type:complete
MSETVNMNYIINDVEALWPRINRTYKFDPQEQRSVPCEPADAGAAYTLQFKMNESQAKELYKKMAQAYKSKSEESWPDKFPMPFKKDGDSFTFKTTLKGVYGVEATRKPSQFDAGGKVLGDDFLLTTGSTVNIAVVFVPYHGAIGTGVSLRLKAVQVVDLAPMQEEKSPFGVVDGYKAEDKAEDDNPFAEIEEPKKAAKKAAPPKPDKDSDDLSSIIDDWDD